MRRGNKSKERALAEGTLALHPLLHYGCAGTAKAQGACLGRRDTGFAPLIAIRVFALERLVSCQEYNSCALTNSIRH